LRHVTSIQWNNYQLQLITVVATNFEQNALFLRKNSKSFIFSCTIKFVPKLLRKFLQIFLLACFIINMSGGWLLFGIYRQEAKLAMANFIQLNKDHLNLVQLKITPANSTVFDIQDGGNEVAYNNVLYDVVLKEHCNDTTILRCVQDENETSLVNAFNKSLEPQHQPSPASKAVTRYISLNQIYVAPRSIPFLAHSSVIISLLKKVFNNGAISSIASKVVTPPPQYFI
jgi:hypothetical protein